VDLTRTRIYASAEGTLLLVNSKRRKNGIVEDSDREGVLRLAEKALLAVRDPETGYPVVRRVINPLSSAAPAGMGGVFGGDLYFELAEGYAPQGGLIGEPVTKRQVPTGNHALCWITARTGFLFSGPELKKCINIGPVRLIDLAPTFCRYLGIEPPANSEGRILEGVINQPSSERP
jgi:predicted AlkP superfamily phosphohydrolase/phosphomutase